MSHLKGYIHERKLDVRSYAVEQRLKFTRGLPEDVENSGKPGASCDLLETHVIIDSDEAPDVIRSEEHTSELQSLMRISYAVFCLKKKNIQTITLIKISK